MDGVALLRHGIPTGTLETGLDMGHVRPEDCVQLAAIGVGL